MEELDQQVVTKLDPTLPAGRPSWVIRTEEGGWKEPELATEVVKCSRARPRARAHARQRVTVNKSD